MLHVVFQYPDRITGAQEYELKQQTSFASGTEGRMGAGRDGT
jgi:hypothetical protein